MPVADYELSQNIKVFSLVVRRLGTDTFQLTKKGNVSFKSLRLFIFPVMMANVVMIEAYFKDFEWQAR